MKKILTVLAAIVLTATASTVVVACGTSKVTSNDGGNNDKPENKLQMKITQNNNELMAENGIVSIPDNVDFNNTKFVDEVGTTRLKSSENNIKPNDENNIVYQLKQQIYIPEDISSTINSEWNNSAELNQYFEDNFILEMNGEELKSNVLPTFFKCDDGKWILILSTPAPKKEINEKLYNYTLKLKESHDINLTFNTETFSSEINTITINSVNFIDNYTIEIKGKNLPRLSSVGDSDDDDSYYILKDSNNNRYTLDANDYGIDSDRSSWNGGTILKIVLSKPSNPDLKYSVVWSASSLRDIVSDELVDKLNKETENINGYGNEVDLPSFSSEIIDLKSLADNKIQIIPKKVGKTTIIFYDQDNFKIDFELKIEITN